jgi:hypothetical protein
MGLLDLLLGKKRKATRSEAHKCGLPQGATVRVKTSRDSQGKTIKTIRFRGRVHGREVH